nr:PREDICTED: zinc finger protein 350-like isoform X2 [Megachile rotundata]
MRRDTLRDGYELMNELVAFQFAQDTKDTKMFPDVVTLHSPHAAQTNSMQRYMCGECGKAYTRMANLRRHQRLECGKEPKHHCRICWRKFYRRYELTNHFNTRHSAP